MNLPSNYIVTTIYNPYNFLPLSIMNQFRRLSNVYFLGILVSQFIPILQVWDPWADMGPFLFVVSVGMIREAVEDIFRHISDKYTNATPVQVVRCGALTSVRSDELQPGDLTVVRQDETFAADLILLASAHP